MLKDLEHFQELAKYLLQNETDEPVAKLIEPKILEGQLQLQLSEQGINDNKHQELLKDILRFTPKTNTNRFFNQLFGGRQSKGVLGELLAVMLNNSMYTYKVAGPQVGIEKAVINASIKQINYPVEAGGTFPTGGSMSNFMALLMARDWKQPDAAQEGISSKMTLYTSAVSHYSNAKNAAFAGVGRKQIRKIACNDKDEMLPDELEKAILNDIKAGYQPFYINATAGTTVLGAFDPVNEISAIAKRHGLWLHIDGAYCGSLIFSEKYKHLLGQVNLADSFSYNAHKMLGVPLTCSILLVKDKKHLYQSFSNEASYLYQSADDDFNLGKTSLQCGRRNDALKFWSLWKSIGTKGLEALIDKQFYLADVARDYIRSSADYTLYSYDDSISLCFNYKNWDAEELCTRLNVNGELMVGYGHQNNQSFVRLVTINPNNEKEDILNFFKVLEEQAK